MYLLIIISVILSTYEDIIHAEHIKFLRVEKEMSLWAEAFVSEYRDPRVVNGIAKEDLSETDRVARERYSLFCSHCQMHFQSTFIDYNART